MSGGRFNYDQYRINEIAEQIRSEIDKMGTKKDRSELYMDSDYYKKYPDELYHYKYPDEIIKKFEEAITYLKIASIYAQRVDYLLSGDDSEESFLKRLNDELLKLK